MAQANKTTTRPTESPQTREDGTYEEVHAAIQALFRLMGVRSDVYSMPAGYGAYTYPVAGSASRGTMPTTPVNPSIWAGPQVFMLPQDPMNGQLLPNGYGNLPTQVPTFPTWGV